MDSRNRLLAAVLEGNVQKLTDLYDENNLILHQALVGVHARQTFLHIAAEEGHAEVVQFILGKDRDLAFQLDAEGLSPLHLACRRGHAEVVMACLDYRGTALFAIRDNEGRTPLHFAAMVGDRDIIRMALTRSPHLLWSLTNKGETILHVFANDKKHHNINWLVVFLADHGFEGLKHFINKKDDKGNTILHLLAVDNYHAGIINTLFARGLNVNTVNEDGSTALDIALDRVGFHHRWYFIYTLKRAGGKTSKKIGGLRKERTLVPLPEEEPKYLERFRTSLLRTITLLTFIICVVGITPPLGYWTSDGFFVHPLTSAKIHHTTGMCILPQTRPHLHVLLMNAIFSGIISYGVTQFAMLFNNSGFGWRFVYIAFGSLFLAVSSIINVFATLYYILNNYSEHKHVVRRMLNFNIDLRRIFIAYSILVFLLIVLHSTYTGRFLRWTGTL